MLFESLRARSERPADLGGLIRQARRRWRMRIALRGLAAVAAAGLALLLAAAYAMEWARFSPTSIFAFRIVTALVVAASAAYFLARPLLRRVTDEQVALYLEEHEPSLQATVVSAVEAARHQGASADTRASAAFVRRLVEQAIERCVAVDAARSVERAPLRRYGAALGGVALAAVAVFLLGPPFIRHAVSALLLVSRSVEAAAPYRIEVTPGDVTIPKGADQSITARLHGFAADEASLMVRSSADAPYEPLPLVRGDDGQYEGMLFDLAAPVDYFVVAAGVRSSVFTVNVKDLPYVQRLELEYRFPSYTGLPPQIVEDGGDIAVLQGTEVHVRVFPTMKAPGGRMVLHEKDTLTLAPGAEGVLAASFTADREGFYRIELDAPTGERVAASPQYTIDILTDQPPAVSLARPGRDTSASPIEEIFVEAVAEDDYGVRDLELVYAVNGGAEKTVKLFAGRTRLPEVSAGHTFFLEELNVEPGDSVSYFARASDNDAVGGSKRATSDLYFLRIRPFGKDFRQAQSMGGGGGGGGSDTPVDALSEQQRQIIAATFNVQRDRRTYPAGTLREHTTVVALAQSRLREQVEGLLTRMNSQLVQPDPSLKRIAELLPQAVEEMKQAEGHLGAVKPGEALPPENRALRLLQKAEEEYETQVTASQGGGGGGGSSRMAEELADLFEQELDKLASQYETADRALQQNRDEQLDALVEKLKELARRQEQEAERRRRAAAGQAASGGAAGARQRALAEAAEEAARRLERLSRDQNRPELGDLARRMREAADAMRRAAAGGQAGAAAAALDRLRDTERRLQQAQSARAERDIQDAQRQAEQLAREQRAIAEGVRGMSPQGDARREQARQLVERKDSLESGLGEFERHLDRIASEAARDERDASRRLTEAAAGIRDNRLRDRIRYSKSMLNGRIPPDSLQATEQEITLGLEALARKLNEAASALGRSRPDPGAEALEKARRLARGLESMQERTEERSGGSGSSKGSGSEGSASDGSRSENTGSGVSGSEGSGREGTGSQRADGSNAGRGDWTGYGPGDGRLWGFSRDDVRQWRGEIREWNREAQALRGLLREGKFDAQGLDEIMRALRALDDPRVYQNLDELRRLQTLAAEGLKRFEFALRRQVESGESAAALSGSSEVPEEFRALVEQYYRSLAKVPR
jgi:hypothetical protein